MSDSDDETQSNKGSPPYQEEEEGGSDDELTEGDFPPINIGPNQLDDVDVTRSARNRVKLYVLCEQRTWDDRGTGHVACVQIPGQAVHVLIVRLEAAAKNVLESKILMDTVYQKQQETLIVWSESETCDLALSFQEKIGCEEIWAKICEVQGKDPVEAENSSFEEQEDGEEVPSDRRIRIPPITKEKLQELDRAVTYHIQNNERREKMSNAIEKEEMIPKLIDIFNQAEQQNDTTSLHFLHNIAKNCILMNRSNIHDIIFDNQYLKEIIGMLEYDPAHETPRRHREFLYDKAHFKEVLPIMDTEIKDKIHKVYRVQYIQDVCLPAPSLFEENLMGALNSYLFFLRVDICQGLQSNETFMKDLFNQLKSSTITLDRRRDLVQFLKEFLSLSQSFPASGCQQKENILKGLFQCDILGTIEPCLQSSDAVIRSTIIELLNKLVDHNAQAVREFFVKNAKQRVDGEILLNQLAEAMHSDTDVELSCANHVTNILRALLDMDSIVSSMQKIDRAEFMNLFYQNSFKIMVRPFLDNIAGGQLKRDDYHTANSTALIVRMLCFCIESHSFNMRSQVVTNDLMNKVLIALNSRHHFLVLTALKMLRSVIGQKDDYYNRYIAREKVLDKVVVCFEKNGIRYNLLNSAIIELFEYIRTEDIKILIKYVIENHSSLLEIEYVSVFKLLKTRYDNINVKERPPSQNGSSHTSDDLARHFEDQWLEAEDDELENHCEEEDEDAPKRQELVLPSVLKRKDALDDEESVFTGHLITPAEKKGIAIRLGSEERSRTPSPSLRDDEVSSSQNGKMNSPGSSNSQISVLRPLVDYDGSSSDDEEDEATNSADSLPSSSTGSPDGAKSPSNPNHSRSPNGEDSVSSTSEDSDEGSRNLKRPLPAGYEEEHNLTDLSSKRIRLNGPLPNGHSSHQNDEKSQDINSSDLFDLTSYNGAEAREAMKIAALKQATDPLFCRVEDYGLLNVEGDRPGPVDISNGEE